MHELRNKVKALFEAGAINLMIGYGEGYNKTVKAVFISSAESVDKLIWDERCIQNLSVYIHKPEVKRFGKIGIVANVKALSTILQLSAENQLKDGQLTILTVSPKGEVRQFENYAEIENYLLANYPEPIADDKKKLEDLLALDREHRWEYWTNELEKCIKCYACRSACPLCYCPKCTVEMNQPQWIPVSSHAQGNFEWHVMRAMHLAGRCIECNQCLDACPMDIPLNLLTLKLNQDIFNEFGQKSGMKATLDFALNSFKNEDKENFIR